MSSLKSKLTILALTFKLLFSLGIYLFISAIQPVLAEKPLTDFLLLKEPKPAEWHQLNNTFNAVVVEFLEEDKNAFIVTNPDSPAIKVNLDIEDGNETNFSTIIYFPETSQIWLDTPAKVNLHLYNTKIKPNTLISGDLYVGDLKIISRAEWGADETIRYDYNKTPAISSNPDMTQKFEKCQEKIDKYPEDYVYDRVVPIENDNVLLWARQYSKKIQKIVIHHTAESDQSASIPGGDRIRSIYYYHARTKGWGDIGYNFLIDQDGNIYEGRAGGDYVVGGHVYCSNVNTMGISLMGNFMRNQPTKKQITTLAKLVKNLGEKYNLDISGENTFHGETKSTLLGHRDLGPSACPGDNLYNIFPLIRKHFSAIEKKLGFLNETPTSITPAESYGATLTGNPTIINMPSLSSKEVTLTYKNTGSATWGKGTWLYASNNDNDKLWAESIILDKNYVIADLEEDTVKSGEIGHFKFTINAGISEGIQMLELIPILNGERKMNSASVLLTVQIDNTHFDYEFVKAAAPKNPFYYGQKIEAEVILKNTGTAIWYRADKFAITMAVPNGQKSGFTNLENPTIYAWLKENYVEPGQAATFVFDLNAGFKEGVFEIPFLPKVGDSYFLKDVGMKFTIQVKKPNYQAQILYDNDNLLFKAGETKTVKVGLKNMSDTEWQENQISLRVVDNAGTKLQQDVFYFPYNVPIKSSAYIDLTISAPIKAGEYKVKFQILANNKKFNETRWLYLPLKVDGAMLSGEITYLSANNLKLDLGETADIILRVKNTSNVAWQKDGDNTLRLVNTKANSSLKSKSWVSNTIVAYMDTKEVTSLKVATFKFKINKNTVGSIKETFVLKTKSLGEVQDTKFELIVDDKTSPTAPVIKTKTNLVPKTNEKIKTKLNGKINKTSSLPIIKTSNISLSSKIEQKRTKVTKEVKKAEFTNKITQKKNVLNNNVNNNTNNQIRVLLSFPESSANVITDFSAKVLVDDQFFANLNKNDALWTRMDNGKMLVSVNNKKKTGNIIRVVLNKNTGDIFPYLSLFNWHRPLSWSANVNDNLFEGNLEFRIINDKMAVINELDFEAYMRGIAEVPESESNEKRKAMAILARSYATHYTQTSYKKFPGLPYDGHDSASIFQKYLGYGYALRAPKWQKALAETAGEVVFYKDEILRTAYFSCSNGKTKTPIEANWNSEYFKKVSEVYKSVDDKNGKSTEKYEAGQCGHGVGLSGLGARNMSEQGKTYQEIIHYYYQNVEIKKI